MFDLVRVPRNPPQPFQVPGRVSQDWQLKYGHPIYLLETFVEQSRFAGTCYRAANWLCVGQTQGRGRQGPNPLAPTEPIKDVFLYPLIGRLRQRLQAAPRTEGRLAELT